MALLVNQEAGRVVWQDILVCSILVLGRVGFVNLLVCGSLVLLEYPRINLIQFQSLKDSESAGVR